MASASVVLTSDTSGSVTVTVPSGTALGTTTLTLPTSGGTIQTSGAGFTTNGVAYASSTSALATGSSLVWTGTNLGVGVTSPVWGVDISNSTGAGFRYKSTTGSGTIVVDSTGTGAGGSGISCRKNGTAYAVFGVSGWINGDTSTDAQIFADGSSGIRFCVSGSVTPSATIDSSGNLLVGTTANDPITGIHDRLQVYTTGSAQFAGFFDNQSTTSAYGVGVRSYTGANMYFFNGTGVSSVGAISTTGSTTTYSPTSDIRLKTNIKPITNGLERISKLKPVDYDWIADGIADNGFIAQDLLEIPEFAHRVTKVGLNNDGEPFYGVDYMKFVAVLTSAIQEQQALITAQQSTIQSLTERITALEGART